MSARGAARAAAKAAITSCAAAFDAIRQPAAGITILIYHRVGAGRGGEMDLAPAEFERQLDHLIETTRVISLDEAAVELASTSTSTWPAVVLTFDDGSADWIDVVAPMLAARGLPATWYVATSFIESGALPDGMPAASWSGLTDAAASGEITIGSHTHRHLLLDRLDRTSVGDELDRSIDLITMHTGRRPRHFAYPKAVRPSTSADAQVRRRFDTAVLAGTRANLVGADLHTLNRSPIQASDDLRSFDRKVAGGMHLEDAARTAANRVRYRGRVD